MQQAIRVNVHRLPRQVPVICTRKLSATPRTMAFFPQFQNFSPLFRLMDEVERSFPTRETFNAIKAYSPRVNVSEEQQQYLLQAEVPGFEQKDVNIEWTDANTLTISGRTQSQVEASPASEVNTVAAETPAPATPASEHQASVEDVVDEDTSRKPSNDEWVNLPSVETDTSSTPAPAAAEQKAVQPAPAASQQTVQQARPQTPKYWVKERSVGEFSRSFSFPTRVDHDNVKASLRNGILSVVVPKAQLPKTRRIVVE